MLFCSHMEFRGREHSVCLGSHKWHYTEQALLFWLHACICVCTHIHTGRAGPWASCLLLLSNPWNLGVSAASVQHTCSRIQRGWALSARRPIPVHPIGHLSFSFPMFDCVFRCQTLFYTFSDGRMNFIMSCSHASTSVWAWAFSIPSLLCVRSRNEEHTLCAVAQATHFFTFDDHLCATALNWLKALERNEVSPSIVCSFNMCAHTSDPSLLATL